MAEDDEIERTILMRGTALLEAVEPERLITLSPSWWQERLLGWASSDPDFRVKLLQFVDVLPTLRSSRAVADHVREYFRESRHLSLQVGASAVPRGPFRPVLSRVVREGVKTMAARFIAGATPTEAALRIRELHRAGVAVTVDLLGEAVLSAREADGYAARYLDLITTLATPGAAADPIRKANVSVKLSALTAHFEPAAPTATSEQVRARLAPLLREARQRGAFVNVDMEQYRFRDTTLTVLEEVLTTHEFEDWPDVGVVVQAYLKDATDVIARIRALAQRRRAPLTVRLVKGAYWDEEVLLAGQEGRDPPVFEEKEETDANFERCTEQLLAAYPALRPAFASHNPRSIAQAMERAERAGLPVADVEFQMLYGMAEGLRKAVQRAGYRTRVYMPIGAVIPGMAYLVRRLLENTSNESWLVHGHEEGEPAELLRVPLPNAIGTPIGEHQGRASTSGGERFQNVQPLEFYLPGVRERMNAALAAARGQFGRTVQPIVAGKEVGGRNVVEVTSPCSPSTVVGRVVQADEALAHSAVSAAVDAFAEWRETSAQERAQCLRAAADLLSERRYELAALEVYEAAKPWREADGDVCEAIDYLRYYATEAERLARGPVLASPAGEHNEYRYEPRGVAAVIAPWNFPLAILAGMTSAAVAAGCTAVVKPAELTPLIAARFVALLHEAGLPPGVVNYLPGPGVTLGAGLVRDPRVSLVAFTGSQAVGLQIARAVAEVAPGQRELKRAILEMGGKNAIVVDEDADLDEAVAGVIASAFGFAGQKCSACSRVIVVGQAAAPFRERLAAAVESLVVGPPEDPYTFVPPVISAEAKARIEEYAQLAEREGRLLARSPIPEGEGHYVAPAVFEGVSHESRLVREEIFGPLLLLSQAASFGEALEDALAVPFALTGGVYSRHPGHIAEARRRFRVGNLYINRKTTGAIVGRQPFGGLGLSGSGEKAGGPDYLFNFVVPRTITENTMRRGFAPNGPSY